ncbi:ATPase with chaperone activity [Piscinibacter sakaiensis]|uniref:ATPase with chaperone activity n=1 Tax=Piscinibacter sakaiensis TaxID=1547922 RepID=A0A0K8P3C2_PISS1|nr:hypothetical protein [Piscinibacter sakaiensis]GAP36665.1 hypothetical protein ISF6_2505 [Piscinibacter sakaiensis]
MADSQIDVPPSFVALYLPPGRLKPTLPREALIARHEFCEDLANLLVETARETIFRLGIAEIDVLERCERGLHLGDPPPVSREEGRWVVRRLAELMGWEDPGPLPVGGRTDEAAAGDLPRTPG